MKKITSLLALFLVVLGISAQNKVNAIAALGDNITELTQLEDGKYYAFKNTGRGAWLHQSLSKTLYLGQDAVADAGCEYIWQAHKATDGKYSFSSVYGDYVPVVTKGGETKAVAVDNKGSFVVSKEGNNWVLKNAANDNDVNWNGNAESGHWWFTGWNDKGVNSQYEIHPVTVKEVDKVKVVYNYYTNGKIVRTEEVMQVPGSDYYIAQFEAQSFVELSFAPGKVVAGQENVVNVVANEVLPFEVTTDLNQPKWQMLDIHSNYGVLFVSVDKSQENKICVKTTASGKNNVLSDFVDDGYYWCFVGNLKDGFKIYNKALGFDYALTNSADVASLVPAAEAASWKVVKSSSTVIANAFVFTADGTNYLNHQGEQLKYWTSADEGSSFRSYVVGDMAQGHPACVAGAVGGYKYFNTPANVEKFNKLYLAFLENPYDYAVVKAYLDEVAVAEATGFDKTVKVEANKMYRFRNATRNVSVNNSDNLGFGAFMGTNFYTVPGYEGQKSDITAGTVDFDDPSTVWVLETEGENFKIKNLNTGKYIGATDANNKKGSVYLKLVEAKDAGVYSVVDLGNAQFKFVCVGAPYHKELHLSGLGVMNYSEGEGSKGNDASSWYVLPATELKVSLTQGWSSLYLPFGVKLPEGVKAYAGTVDATNNKLMLNELTMGVPAGCGAILKGTSDNFILTIADVTASDVANDLIGTCVDINRVEGSLVLGKGAGGFGMYIPMGAVMKANKAYVAPKTAVNSLAFAFGEATGVENVEVAVPTDNVYYDLSGRRVANPVKGVYILNGKKVYVK